MKKKIEEIVPFKCHAGFKEKGSNEIKDTDKYFCERYCQYSARDIKTCSCCNQMLRADLYCIYSEGN